MASAKSTLKAAKKTLVKTLSGAKSTAEPDILATLKREHDEVKKLLAALEKEEGAAARRRLVQQIKAALVPHTKAEEKVVYDAVISTADEDAEVDGHEGYLEHECATETLKHLEVAEPTSAEHKAAGKVLKELVESHIKEEERNVWRDVREHFDDDARMRMNAEFEAAKRQVTLS
jgi:Hemerythrin HHE cation binding domain